MLINILSYYKHLNLSYTHKKFCQVKEGFILGLLCSIKIQMSCSKMFLIVVKVKNQLIVLLGIDKALYNAIPHSWYDLNTQASNNRRHF